MRPIEPLSIDNPGLVLFGDVPADVVLVITGLARTGTSAVAELVSSVSIGLPCLPAPGPWQDYHNHEDYELAELVEQGREAEARALVDARPWRRALKRPFIFRHAELLRRLFGDRLAWLFVFRDPLSSSIREASVYLRDLPDAFQTTMDGLHELVEFALAAPEPKAFLSYEKTLLLRPQIINQLGRWINA